jgi:hypothetical protein
MHGSCPNVYLSNERPSEERIQVKLSSTFDSVLFDDLWWWHSLIQTPGVIPSRIALIDSFYDILYRC